MPNALTAIDVDEIDLFRAYLSWRAHRESASRAHIAEPSNCFLCAQLPEWTAYEQGVDVPSEEPTP